MNKWDEATKKGIVEILKELDNVVLDRSSINNKAQSILREIGEMRGEK